MEPPDATSIRPPYSATDDWDALVESYEDRKPHQGLLALIQILTTYSDLHVVFMTGRARTQRQEATTRRWLSNNVPSIPSYSLYMRAPGDYRIDHEVKKDLTRLCVERYEILLSIDDREDNLKMWAREFNIPGFSVSSIEG